MCCALVYSTGLNSSNIRFLYGVVFNDRPPDVRSMISWPRTTLISVMEEPGCIMVTAIFYACVFLVVAFTSET